MGSRVGLGLAPGVNAAAARSLRRGILYSMSATDQLEVEWQFAVGDSGAATRWLEAAVVPGYTVAPGPTKQLDDTYFDTGDWRVHRAGFTCRVRRKGATAELTLKSMAPALGAVRSRRELTEPLTPGCADQPEAAPGLCGEILRTLAGRHSLRPIFRLCTNRKTFLLSDAAGQLAEIAVDETTIPAGEAAPAFLQRVEIEVEAGGLARAQRFVDLLVAALDLRPAGTSKFEAALIATGQRVPEVGEDLGPTSVSAEMTAGEVGFAVLRKHFGAFLRNEPGTRLGEDPEALHDMRVATRRMRAAMSLFAPYLPPRVATYRAQFGWVAAVLGAVRDLDVQLERISEWQQGVGESQAQGLAAVGELLSRRREAARRRMLFALNSRRFETLLERFASLLHHGPPRTFAAGHEPILSVAPALVEKRYRRVRRNGDAITPTSPPADYHALRIDAKKLRYALEFVAPVYGRPAASFIARVTALQDVLGLHQDAEVAVTMLEEMASQSGRRLGPSALLAMGAVAERYRQHAVELRGQFPKVYRPLAGEEWRRLLKAMESRR